MESMNVYIDFIMKRILEFWSVLSQKIYDLVALIWFFISVIIIVEVIVFIILIF